MDSWSLLLSDWSWHLPPLGAVFGTCVRRFAPLIVDTHLHHVNGQLGWCLERRFNPATCSLCTSSHLLLGSQTHTSGRPGPVYRSRQLLKQTGTDLAWNTPQPPLCCRAAFHQIEGIGAITPACLKPPKCVEQVAHNALLLLFGSCSQDGRFHNAFKWHITGRRLPGLPRTISPGAKEEQQAAARTFFNKERGKKCSAHLLQRCALFAEFSTSWQISRWKENQKVSKENWIKRWSVVNLITVNENMSMCWTC